jgi:hypothetical protein
MRLSHPMETAPFFPKSPANSLFLVPQKLHVLGHPNDADWRSDPRMPLLQDALAKKLNADVDEVEIGVYDFVAGQHYATKFNLSQIKDAQRKLYTLLSEFGK